MLSIIRAGSRLVDSVLGLFPTWEPSSLLGVGSRSGAEHKPPGVLLKIGRVVPGPSQAGSLEA